MVLREWLEGKDLSENEEKKLAKYLDIKVGFEFMIHDESTFIPWSTFGSQKNVYNWVLLENKVAVGCNENLSRGWSFPSKKLNVEEMKLLTEKLLSNLKILLNEKKD